jgi:predicted heme/steroid binding protein
MDELELRRIIYSYIKEICHYSQMQVFATSFYQKNYFQLQIDESINGLSNFYLEIQSGIGENQFYTAQQQNEQPQQQNEQPQEQNEQPQQQNEQPQQQNEQPQQQNEKPQEQSEQPQQQNEQQEQPQNGSTKIFTTEELAYYDGGEGRPAYVAVNGVVYDVSSKMRWAGGRHFGLRAGRDVSNQFMGCHQGMLEVLNSLPRIGVLQE